MIVVMGMKNGHIFHDALGRGKNWFPEHSHLMSEYRPMNVFLRY